MAQIVFFCLLAISTLRGVDFHDFDAYQYQFTQEEIKARIDTYLEKDTSIRAFYDLTPQALYMDDYVLHLKAEGKSRNSKVKRNGLNGVKIALDPGHFGGAYAELEERFVKTANGAVRIDEGTLTYLTALELKSLLETEGAIVFLTRSGIGQGAIDISFEEWQSEHPEESFRTGYNRADLAARAAKINAFAPDLTLVIHYNGHHSAFEKAQKLIFTESNFNLLFIPGAFCKHELDTPEERYEFLRLLVTTDLEESLKLCQAIAPYLVAYLHVPLIEPDEITSYTQKACLFQTLGIYARNLALTRMVHGPVCYGETLIQNNMEEFCSLSARDNEINGIPCSSRLKQVAKAYFDGIKSYLQK